MFLLLYPFIFIVILFFLRRISFRFGLIDFPNERKIHTLPIPPIGGLVIYFTLLIYTLFNNINPYLDIIYYTSFIILVIGLVDDIYELNFLFRLFFQICSASIIIYFGLFIVDLGDYLYFNFNNLSLFGILLTIFAVVSLANSINFIDGIDGLSSSLIIIAITSLYIFSYISN